FPPKLPDGRSTPGRLESANWSKSDVPTNSRASLRVDEVKAEASAAAAARANNQRGLVGGRRSQSRAERRRQLEVLLVHVEADLRRAGAADVQPARRATVPGETQHEGLRAGQVEVGSQEDRVVPVRLHDEPTVGTAPVDTGE